MSRDIMTAADYTDYVSAVSQFMEREGIKHGFSRGSLQWECNCGHENTGVANCAECEECEADYDESHGDPYFSWHPCECCGGTLGGNRIDVLANCGDSEVREYAICEDCYYFAEYGRLDDTTMLRVGL
jgi:hypothetical protein